MVKRFYYVNNSVPSEEFKDDTNVENQIDVIDGAAWFAGIIRNVSSNILRIDPTVFQSSEGWYYKEWLFPVFPGLIAKIVSSSYSDPLSINSPAKEYIRIKTAAQNDAWDTGDDGDHKIGLVSTPSLAASGDYVVIMKPDWEYIDPVSGGVYGDGIRLSTLFGYHDADKDNEDGFSIGECFSADSGSFTLSSTRAYDGSYSYRSYVSTGTNPSYGLLSFGVYGTVVGPGVQNGETWQDDQIQSQYFSFYFWHNTTYRAEPKICINTPNIYVGEDRDTSTEYYCYKIGNAAWAASTVPIISESWNLMEITRFAGIATISINGSKVCDFSTSMITNILLRAEYTTFSGTDSDNYVYFDKFIHRTPPNQNAFFRTSLLSPPSGFRLSRWETLEISYGMDGVLPGEDYWMTITGMDSNNNGITSLNSSIIDDQSELALTDIDAWNYNDIKLGFTVKWFKKLSELDPQIDFKLTYWTLKYSRGPDAISYICEQNSGISYNDISPNAQIDTETTAISVWRSRYNEQTHPVFDVLFDFGDGHNSDWQGAEKFSHVFDRACESGYSDSFYPFFIARDQYGGISASGCAVNLNVWQTSNNLLRVLGDYSTYGQHKRAWIKTGAALDRFYHIESAAYSTGTTTFTLDDHYDLETDGVVANDIVDIIDVLNGDFDGTNESFKVISNKVETTAVLRGRPIVAVSGSTIIFDASESFTPNSDESLTYYYFDSDDSEISTGTSSSYSHLYDTAGTYSPTLYVRDSSLTGPQKQSASSSLTITIQTADEAGVPAFADVYDLRANLNHQPNDITKGHTHDYQESEARVDDYPTYIDTRKKKQTFNMKGVAKPLKYYPGAGTTNLDAGELDIITLGTLWKNGTIFKYQYRSTRLSGASDVKWFVGRIVDFTWHEIGGQPHHYEWTAECIYVPGIAGSDQEI